MALFSVCNWIFLCWCFSFQLANAEDGNKTKISYLQIKSEIQSRFAITLMTSRVKNLGNVSREIFFNAVLPEEAFITNFSMHINNQTIFGNVKEKVQAKKEYMDAVQRGQSAGLVAEVPRETNAFQISVNVAPSEHVTFNLTYQEILKRVHGVYKHVIHFQVDQPVLDSKIDVFINEIGEISNVSVPEFGSKIGEKTNLELLDFPQESSAEIKVVQVGNVSHASVSYRPVADRSTSTNGQLVVMYDVARDGTSPGGSLQTVDGYFVHFFAPSGLTKSRKNVLFVLDKSGSMYGRKFEQTKAAMKRILTDLDEEDKFNIMMFSSEVELWRTESVRASNESKTQAIRFVDDTEASGGTAIYDALIRALGLLHAETVARSDSSSPQLYAGTVLFLTDGEANVGQSEPDAIVRDVTELNSRRQSRPGDNATDAAPGVVGSVPKTSQQPSFSLHSLAFGRGADYKLLRRLSEKNRGLARRIYEDSDADLQLTGFYAEIASPLLADVQIDYLNGSIDASSLVRSGGYDYYEGGELVVVGRLEPPPTSPDAATSSIPVVVPGPSSPEPEPLFPISPYFGARVRARRPAVGWAAADGAASFFTAQSSCVYPRSLIFWPRPKPSVPEAEPVEWPSTFSGFIERMWAYLTVKKLLKDYELEDINVNNTKAEALRLSLKYKFVTALTSMVVIQPDTLSDNRTVDLTPSIELQEGAQPRYLHPQVLISNTAQHQYAHPAHQYASPMAGFYSRRGGYAPHGLSAVPSFGKSSGGSWSASYSAAAVDSLLDADDVSARNGPAVSMTTDLPEQIDVLQEKIDIYLDVTNGFSCQVCRAYNEIFRQLLKCLSKKVTPVAVRIKTIRQLVDPNCTIVVSRPGEYVATIPLAGNYTVGGRDIVVSDQYQYLNYDESALNASSSSTNTRFVTMHIELILVDSSRTIPSGCSSSHPSDFIDSLERIPNNPNIFVIYLENRASVDQLSESARNMEASWRNTTNARHFITTKDDFRQLCYLY